MELEEEGEKLSKRDVVRSISRSGRDMLNHYRTEYKEEKRSMVSPRTVKPITATKKRE